MMIRDHVRLFVSSRPLHTIVDVLSDLLTVSMEDMADKLSADIELHVTREVDARQRLRDLDPGFKMEIRSVLCEKADGMFRWVQCSIDTLDRCVTRKEVHNALDSLPKGLDETYERILLAIDMETLSGRLAQRALVWLVAAQRNLRLTEITEALSINLKTRRLDPDIGPMHSGALLDACGSLVTYSEKTGIIILAHFSVKEYLAGEFTRTNLPAYYISSEQAHLLLAQSCMCYLSICLRHAQRPADASGSRTTGGSSQFMVRLHPKSHPLLDYALDDALDHFGHLGSTFESALHDVTVLAEDIQQHSWIWDHVCIPRRDTWEFWGKPRWPAAVHDLLLYILVAFASDSFMETFLRRIPLKPKKGTNPLVYAAYFDKAEHARMLLSVGAGLNQRGWETVGYRQSLPIEVAFWNEHYAMVTLFVEEGSTVPSHIFTDSFFGQSWVQIPSSITINKWPNMTALHATKTSNHLVFRKVAEEDLIAIIRRFTQEAFFCLAVAQGYLSAVRYLRTLGTSLPSDVLVRWRTASMIRFLVENGVDVLVSTSSGDSDDILEAVKLLVDLGCNPLEADSHGNTPLRIAIERGYISVAQYLLTLGEPLPSDLFVTLDPFMIHFLVENGVDPLVHTADGDSLLHVALEVVKVLVDYHCDPLEANSCGTTPVHIAVKRGLISVARHLITVGASLPPDLLVTLRESGWSTAPMIQFLVENHVNVLAHTSDGDSMLHIALEVVRLLVSYGCDPLEVNLRGKTPLHIAVERNLISVTRYLLAFRSNITPRMIRLLVEDGVNSFYMLKLLIGNPPGNTLLLAVVERGYDCVARYLLSLGIHPCPDLFITLNHLSYQWSGRTARMMIPLLVENGINVLTPLHIILSAAARILIDYGCDPLEANTHGKTPLHIAIERGYTSVARYLVSLGASLPPDFLTTLDYPMLYQPAAHMIPFLAENGVNVLAHTRGGDSALHVSLYDDDEALEAAKVLVAYGCNPLEANARGTTPLGIAVERGHISVAQYFVSLGASLPPDPLVTLSRDRSYWSIIPMVRFLVENGVDVLAHADDGDSLLHVALRILEVVKLLVSLGCNPLEVNARGTTPLCIAVERGHISVAQYFVSFGAPLPPDLLVTLDRARSHWSTAAMIRFLVENRVNVLAHADDGDSLLHVALRILEVVKLLVSFGCDPLGANSRGNTPLHIAVQHYHISAVQYLLTLGAPLPPDLLVTLDRARSHWSTAAMIRFLVENRVDVLAHANDGDSVLHSALRCLNWDSDVLEAAKFLIGYGCDPLEANSRGETPLHIAAERSHVSVASYLITQGANTVLHFATRGVYPYPYDDEGADNCTLAAVELFVGRGSDPAVPNDNGETPLHNAYLLSLNNPLPLDILFTAIQSDQNSVCCRYIVQTLTPNAEGDTPLQVAIKKGKVDVAKYLLSVVSDLLSAAALAPPSIQSEMRRMLSDRRARSESPELHPAKRVKHS
ncbi:ankyrin repeat-containing domain protein [Boletus edulis BED1]|uniref:Ankyrin repeat-containing domain protein n=1 Tax=Boletus edulis BED1 TaxID=1328754 RepID=A0AAD4C251_BOLED|nr:ankyrin repeat-containing domain protein [Boletus edulis BED1]